MLARPWKHLRWSAAAYQRCIDAVRPPIRIYEIAVAFVFFGISTVGNNLTLLQSEFSTLLNDFATRSSFHRTQEPSRVPGDEDPVAVALMRRQIGPTCLEREKIRRDRGEVQETA